MDCHNKHYHIEISPDPFRYLPHSVDLRLDDRLSQTAKIPIARKVVAVVAVR
jgi:hypothetical protein